MAGNIYLYSFNNYTNRIVKKYDTLAEYGTPLYSIIDSVNFKPGDGVTTKQVVYFDDASKADYLIYTNIAGDIVSRWFIIESMRLSQNNYELSLKRDIIADNYNALMNSTAFIEKATVNNKSPFILNQEQLSVNQIKTKEQPLYDETGCAWIVGYIDRKYAADVDKKEIKFTINAAPRYDYTKDTWPFYKSYGTVVNGRYTSRKLATHEFTDAQKIITSRYEKLYWDWTEYSQDVIDEGLKQAGLVIKDGDKYYKVKAELRTSTKYPVVSVDKEGRFLYTYYTEQFGQQTTFVLMYEVPQLRLTLYEIPSTVDLDVNISGKTESETVGVRDLRPGLTDAPYDMFCMPYMDGALTLTQPTTDVTINITKEMSIAIAQSIVLELGSANVYDLQLLPYCPLSGFTKTTDGLTIDRFRHLDNIVGTQNSPYSYYQCLFWCQQSHGTKNIILDDMPSYTNRKISNQCDMYRLVSPNYNGQFEFNLAQNNTRNLPYFNVDYTYMPYNPYIHVNPYFSGLYGDDYNDARGLICGGDYSIAYLSDAWKTYQINNKNYQNIFDRQIQNMSTNYKNNQYQEIISAILSSIGTGVATGVMTGSVLGGAAGTAISSVGGVLDLQMGLKQYAESLSYAKDVYNYQLDNIKAMPYSIAKSTVINENNKEVPILETFTCTEEEKIAVANEIANAGMTIGVIGKINDYTGIEWSYAGIESRGFIKGRIIKLNDFMGDAHEALDLKQEFQKGVYING